MLFARLQTILVALILIPAVNAASYLDLEFSSSTHLDDYFDCNRSGEAVYRDGYAHIDDLSGNWQLLRSTQFNYEVMACTSIVGEQPQKTRLTTRQSYLIDSENYIFRFDARSGLYKVKESFYVCVIADSDAGGNGTDNASTGTLPSGTLEEHILLEVDDQDHRTKTYALSLKEFQGQRVRISIVATSTQGWMLLLDNIFLGEPTECLYTSTNLTPYNCPLNGSDCVTLRGNITSVGRESSDNLLELYIDNKLSSTLDMGQLPTGEEKSWEFLVPGQKFQPLLYSVRVNGCVIASGNLVPTTFSHRVLTDHFTGTWCNNCPVSMLEVIDLEEKYGNELMTLNTHIGANDLLTQSNYTSHFEVYAIPQFYFDHEPGPYSIDKDYLPPTLKKTPTAGINLWAERDDQTQKVKFKVETIFLKGKDNSTDRYRVGLMLLGDFYDPANGLLAQSNMQPLLQKGGVLHYTRDGYILPKVEWHFDIPYNTEYAFEGVEGSLPKTIESMHSMIMDMSLDIPDYLERYQQYTGSPLQDSALSSGYPVTAVAMVIDTKTNQVLNCAKVYLPVGQEGVVGADSNFDYPNVAALKNIEADNAETDVRYYNLNGVEVKTPSVPGIYLKRTPASTTKVLIR